MKKILIVIVIALIGFGAYQVWRSTADDATIFQAIEDIKSTPRRNPEEQTVIWNCVMEAFAILQETTNTTIQVIANKNEN